MAVELNDGDLKKWYEEAVESGIVRNLNLKWNRLAKLVMRKGIMMSFNKKPNGDIVFKNEPSDNLYGLFQESGPFQRFKIFESCLCLGFTCPLKV
uniref:Uncharacterized protein n=1 Tax=Cucumis melo TaxID=3656 RepID=A0A9I9EEX2_CUCME